MVWANATLTAVIVFVITIAAWKPDISDVSLSIEQSGPTGRSEVNFSLDVKDDWATSLHVSTLCVESVREWAAGYPVLPLLCSLLVTYPVPHIRNVHVRRLRGRLPHVRMLHVTETAFLNSGRCGWSALQYSNLWRYVYKTRGLLTKRGLQPSHA